MEHMIGMALYVCATDTRRTKRFPFREQDECPRQITDAATGDVFNLVSRHYEVGAHELDAAQARVRAWNARHHGRLAVTQDVTADDEATAAFRSEAA